jgi:hypothetical protein
VYWSKTGKKAKTVQSASATYHLEINPRRGPRSSSESAGAGVQRKKRHT